MEMEARYEFFFLFILAGASGQGLTLSVFCKIGNGRSSPSRNSGLVSFALLGRQWLLTAHWMWLLTCLLWRDLESH